MRLTYTAKLTLSMAIPTAMVAGAGGCVFVGATWLAGLAASLPPGAIAGHLRLGAIGIAGLTVLCVATCIGVTMWIRRAAHRELGTDPERARRLLAEIAAGNLAVGVGSAPAGSVLDSIAGLSSHLNGLLAQIRSASESVDVASREVAAGNMDLSHRTEVAAGQLQQVASSMSRVAETVRHNADAAREASRMAAMAGDVAGKGGEVVSQVVSTMGAIESSSREIAEIIATVDGLAFQTNILALNAAVEAARAGEQGRGFAVVASEVRALAGRSAEAARSIKTLITASVERVDAGSRLVQDAGATMDEIVASVQRVSAMIERISGTTEEQSDGIGRVGGAVEQIDQMTQQNAALVEQSAAVAESLKDQAAKLHQVVETFHLRSG